MNPWYVMFVYVASGLGVLWYGTGIYLWSWRLWRTIIWDVSTMTLVISNYGKSFWWEVMVPPLFILFFSHAEVYYVVAMAGVELLLRLAMTALVKSRLKQLQEAGGCWVRF